MWSCPGESSVGLDTGCTESATLEPTNPYSAAKAGAEMMAKAYMTSYKMPVIITRGNNVYGPHQFPEKLVPKFTLLASRGSNLPIHGEGKSVRSYLYVEDVAEAFDVVLHKVLSLPAHQHRLSFSLFSPPPPPPKPAIYGEGKSVRICLDVVDALDMALHKVLPVPAQRHRLSFSLFSHSPPPLPPPPRPSLPSMARASLCASALMSRMHLMSPCTRYCLSQLIDAE